MGAVGTSNVAGGTSGVASAKSFVVNFLDKKFCRFFVKILSRFFAVFFSQPRAGGRSALP